MIKKEMELIGWLTINNKKIYFDSFGNVKPPIELQKYFGEGKINYNYRNYQDFDTFICEHLCLKFLCNQLHRKVKFSLLVKGI